MRSLLGVVLSVASFSNLTRKKSPLGHIIVMAGNERRYNLALYEASRFYVATGSVRDAEVPAIFNDFKDGCVLRDVVI